MNRKIIRLVRFFTWAVASLATVCITGCSVGSTGRSQRGGAFGAPEASAATVQKNGDPGINLQCDVQRIRNAPAPFHWSYKKQVAGLSGADWEANIAHDSIVGTFIDSSGMHVIHALRSDGTSWKTAMIVLTAPLPTSTFALVNHSSAIARAGTMDVNGANAIKYTIDTSKEAPADVSLIHDLLGTSGFVKGTAWVNTQGCPIRFILDVDQHNQDGTAEREHYEANITLR